MSRYLILILLNAPIVATAILGLFVSYKLKRISRLNLLIRTTFWLAIFAGLLFTKAIYTWLYDEGLTESESLSLFDVLLITSVFFLFLIVGKLHTRISRLDKNFKELHQELSISSIDKN